ncbi:acyl-[ACP]--phospholipid O-acyltransferase [Helicobacter cappadocius]|uniref:Acyl-[ACP]--phospholipid O-acyltransferase n=1 Tax=Helicobacter cappadocius TaxID=3063998 RepID=A0AA90PLN8_9HELI|nr:MULTISPECIES: acyl-[ACP]--phospholipid O-acyltransferase [unclassified Helicobacter]MDO7253527.1 acyl-[ACP]--phospholipid O-acyltransferase [Helicobacter sp. faydin-H75]MDP2539454.1 acyl-[ACP]--phospholipid O-acyltransferase [Helicobacter sp. faydin-H76]
MKKIWKIYGFTSFIFATFINAFLDLGHKILMQNTILKAYSGSEELIYLAIINALVILPFILTFSSSGFLSDKFPRDKVMKIAAISNFILICLLAVFYFLGCYWAAFWTTFALGIQAAFYSPAKYGYIKDLVGNEFLAWGNGIIQACAIVAILAGMGIFSLLFEYLYPNSSAKTPEAIIQAISPLAIVLIALSLLETFLTLRLPCLSKTLDIKFPTSKYLKFGLLKQNLKNIKKNKIILMSILGISMFWSISQLMLAAFPVHIKNLLEIDNTFEIQASIALSGIGIIIGSMIAGRYSKHYIETGLIPLGALLLSIALIFTPFLSSLFSYGIVFFIFGLGGAILIVPLNSLVQFHSKKEELGSILAGNNFIQNIGMFLFLIIAAFFGYFKLNVEWLFLIAIITSVCVAIYVVILMPFSLVRLLISIALLQRYKLDVEGFDNIPQSGGVLLLGNHISFIDWAIIQMALPRKVHFVMEKSIYSRWYIRLFIDFFGVIPVSNMQSKTALETISSRLAAGEVVCLFPEGSISRHGQLNEFKRGFEIAAKHLVRNQAVILPFYISGLWGSIFSRSNEQFRERYHSFSKRNLSIAFGKSLDIHTTRDTLKKKIFEMSFKAWETQCKKMECIGRAWINSAKKGGSDIAIVDTLSGSMSYTKMLALTLMLSRIMAKNTPSTKKISQDFAPENPCIGIILPASLGSSMCNLACMIANRVVVNLNFTAGEQAVLKATEMAEIKQIYTSRRFLEKLKNKNVNFDFKDIEVFYMEDILKKIKNKKLTVIGYLLMAKIFPAFILKAIFSPHNNTHNIATILFSSGSEGKPKGVMLNHINIRSNISQIADIIHAKDDDCILSSLPPFHAFGLTATTFMPLLENMLSVTHADPTDSIGIAKAIAQNNVTIMCATSTLFGIYARNPKLDKIMFDSLRFIVAGAEKLKPDIAKSFLLKFNKPIYEGYGATETTPVTSVNLPNEFDAINWEIHKASEVGSVGMPLPGTAIRIVDPETLEELCTGEDGLILIGGHQVMKGYLKDIKKTNEVIVEIDGIRWYKSGDKGHLDSDGFLFITDRYSRFAKIGGEMISLGAIEEEVAKIARTIEIEDVVFVATSLEDEKKGEMIILLIENNQSKLIELIDAIKSSNIPPIFKPSKYFIVDKIPTLGSGKVDLKGSKDLAKELIENKILGK